MVRGTRFEECDCVPKDEGNEAGLECDIGFVILFLSFMYLKNMLE